MRLILLLVLMVGACANTLTDEAKPQHQEILAAEPAPPKKPEKPPEKPKPPTVIVIPAPKPVCVPLAVNEKKRILQALDCVLENEKAAKP